MTLRCYDVLLSYDYVFHYSPTRLALGFLQSRRDIGQGAPGSRSPQNFLSVPPEVCSVCISMIIIIVYVIIVVIIAIIIIIASIVIVIIIIVVSIDYTCVPTSLTSSPSYAYTYAHDGHIIIM